MLTIGPYLTFSNKEPDEWCYFALDHNEVSVCYKALFSQDQQVNVNWTEVEMNINKRLYVYDLIDKKSYCFLVNINNKLRRVPLEILAGYRVARLLQKPLILGGGDIAWPNEKMIKDNTVNPKEYPTPSHIECLIPQLSTQLVSEQPIKTIGIDIAMAQDNLQVKQFSRIADVTHCPETISDGSMYVWKHEGQWQYRVGCLGEVQNGIFDGILDASIIEKLNSSSVKLDESFLMSLSRSYLKLNYHQQQLVIGMIRQDWPLISGLSEQEQIHACRSLLARTVLAANTYEEQIINEAIQSFRRCLFPSNINLMGPSFYPTSRKDVTIADVIRFIDYLLVSSLRVLGDSGPITYKVPPSDSHVPCGQYQNLDGHFTQIYQGLNPQESDLFQLVLTYESQGLDALTEQGLEELKKHIQGIMEPQTHQDYMSVSNNILAAIESQQTDTDRLNRQELAKEILMRTCHAIMTKIDKQLEINNEGAQLLANTNYTSISKMDFKTFIEINTILTSIKSDWLISLIQTDIRVLDLICERIIQNKQHFDFFVSFFTEHWQFICPLLIHNNASSAYVDYLMEHPEILSIYIKLVKYAWNFSMNYFYTDCTDELFNHQHEAAKWCKSLIIGERAQDETDHEIHQTYIMSSPNLKTLYEQIFSLIEQFQQQTNRTSPGNP